MESFKVPRQSDKVKKPKIVFNLKDVNKAPEFIKDLPFEVIAYQKVCKKHSLYMVHYAQVKVDRLNYFLNNNISSTA